jgi:hypothetical protein
MKVKGYCHCGGPLWRDDGFCRLCWLESDAAWNLCPVVEGPDTIDANNATWGTTATSQWLPPGQREVKPARSKTERACQFWLRYVQERQDQGEWRQGGRRYLNDSTFMDMLRRLREVSPWPVPDRSVLWSSPWDGISPEQRVLDAIQGHPRRQL